jgi:hypothetical protein
MVNKSSKNLLAIKPNVFPRRRARAVKFTADPKPQKPDAKRRTTA